MDRCKEIEAHIRMEERYQGLSLVFANNEEVKSDIITAIDEVKAETGQTPFIFEKISNDRKDLHAMYIEFRDDIHREGGEFLTKVLKKLNIDKCEKDI
ncbi:hypothetical protein [Sulfurovum sp.]|jgi:hypothetical protein|uniref:hypothetical protein n=1 Tax=Sulfurovum sp. TaxID=1969726 RepID=UPI003564244E